MQYGLTFENISKDLLKGKLFGDVPFSGRAIDNWAKQVESPYPYEAAGFAGTPRSVETPVATPFPHQGDWGSYPETRRSQEPPDDPARVERSRQWENQMAPPPKRQRHELRPVYAQGVLDFDSLRENTGFGKFFDYENERNHRINSKKVSNDRMSGINLEEKEWSEALLSRICNDRGHTKAYGIPVFYNSRIKDAPLYSINHYRNKKDDRTGHTILKLNKDGEASLLEQDIEKLTVRTQSMSVIDPSAHAPQGGAAYGQPEQASPFQSTSHDFDYGDDTRNRAYMGPATTPHVPSQMSLPPSSGLPVPLSMQHYMQQGGYAGGGFAGGTAVPQPQPAQAYDPSMMVKQEGGPSYPSAQPQEATFLYPPAPQYPPQGPAPGDSYYGPQSMQDDPRREKRRFSELQHDRESPPLRPSRPSNLTQPSTNLKHLRGSVEQVSSRNQSPEPRGRN